ncbi:MAG: chromosomal replication initiator protein DnaA [Candidatus Pacebacteria bacterium]|nr:chromosomal replication initiator protein DnaA [Candidatus Paceibacterota bacterium]
MIKEDLWQAVLAQIQFNISSANFTTWFKNTGILSKKNGKIIIAVPNNFSKEWLENKYHKLILKILHNLDKNIKEIEYLVKPVDSKIKKTPIPIVNSEQLEFQELDIDKDTNLNPRYTFNNFVVGPFNELSHAAATAISKDPGRIYNPLFIYGGVGLGKTHLLQAIGNQVIKNFTKKRVKYIPSARFTSEVVSSIRNNTIETLKAKYRTIDVFIIDDIQLIAGKDKTQEEFFHIFNFLYEKDKQIIISSDRQPKAIPAIEERLRSRFGGGMIADISLPDIETRIAILKTKAQEKKIDFSDEVYSYITSHIQTNIRELEGALNRLVAYQKLNKGPLDLKITKSLLKNLIIGSVKITNPKKIIQAVIEFYDLKERDILTPSRKQEIVKPRQIAMFLLREELKSSYPFIGKKLGGKDHTTAIHAYEKITREKQENENLNEEIKLIRQRIYC